MKIVIAVRHGYYSAREGGRLTPEGRDSISTLAKAIKQKLCGSEKIVLLSSPAVRTLETAEIIKESLGLDDYIVNAKLEGDTHMNGMCYMDIIVEHAEAGNADVAIVVTHFEAPAGITDAFSRKHFNKNGLRGETKKGEGLCIDLSTGEITELP